MEVNPNQCWKCYAIISARSSISHCTCSSDEPINHAVVRRPRVKLERMRVEIVTIYAASRPRFSFMYMVSSRDIYLSVFVDAPLMITAVQILCLMNFVFGNKLTLQCKISDNKFKSKGTAQLWLWYFKLMSRKVLQKVLCSSIRLWVCCTQLFRAPLWDIS